MRLRIVFRASGVVLGLLLASCSLIADFGGYHSAGGSDGGGFDGGPDYDAGATDAGATDGGPSGCDPACGASGECVDGVCRCGGGDACAADEACCGDVCVDPTTDVDHCGGCDGVCPGGPRAIRSCASSVCQIDCEPGFADCDAAMPGCESDLGSSATCGGCGTSCLTGQFCGTDASGMRACVDSCGTGEMECSGSCVDVSTSLSHCGTCGHACPSLANATATCSAGTCNYTCTGMFVDCDGDLSAPSTSNGCEIVPPVFYADGDGDDYGMAGAATMRFCPGAAPAGWGSMSGDCDDTDASIHPGARDLCDGIDNDCDGYADDDLVLRPRVTVGTYSTSGGSIFPFEPAVRWVPSRSMGAAVWGSQRGSSTWEMRFSRIDADGRPIVSDAVIASVGEMVFDVNVAWDGAAWVVVFYTNPTPLIRMVRVRDDGTVATPLTVLPGITASDNCGQLAVAQGDGEMAVAYGIFVPQRYRMAVVRNGALAGSTQTLYMNSDPTSYLGRPAIAHVGGGIYGVAYLDDPASALVYQRARSSGLVGPATPFFAGGDSDYPGRAAYDPASDRIAISYYYTSGMAEVLLLDATTAAMLGRRTVTGPIAELGAADDGSLLAAAYGVTAGVRVRFSDATVYPTGPPAASLGWSRLDGLRGTANRFIGISAAGGSGIVETEVLTCR